MGRGIPAGPGPFARREARRPEAAEPVEEPSAGAHRQARLLCEGVAQASPAPADALVVREAYERLHGASAA